MSNTEKTTTLKHLRSYQDVEDLFNNTFPEFTKSIKQIHRIGFKPKCGVILVELKNGCGIRFSATSDKIDGEVIYVFNAELETKVGTKDMIEEIAKVEEAKKAKKAK